LPYFVLPDHKGGYSMDNESQAINIPEKESKKNNTFQPIQERRKVKRSVLTSRNMVYSQIFQEGMEVPHTQYIYINDLSPEGMKVTADTVYPEKTKLKFILNLNEPIELEAIVIWSKEIGTKNYKIGLNFTDSQMNQKGIPALLQWACSHFGKKSFRINAPIQFRFECEGERRSFSAYVIVISPRGIEIKSDASFPENKKFKLTFTLNPSLKPISPHGIVLFQKSIKPLFEQEFLAEFYQVWIEFIDSDVVIKHIQDAQKLDPLIRI